MSYLDSPHVVSLLVHLALGLLGAQLQPGVVVGHPHGPLLELLGHRGVARRPDLLCNRRFGLWRGPRGLHVGLRGVPFVLLLRLGGRLRPSRPLLLLLCGRCLLLIGLSGDLELQSGLHGHGGGDLARLEDLEEPLDVRVIAELPHDGCVGSVCCPGSPLRAEELVDELLLGGTSELLIRVLVTSHQRPLDEVQICYPIEELVGNLEDVAELVQGHDGCRPILSSLVNHKLYELMQLLDVLDVAVGQHQQQEERVDVDLERIRLPVDELADALDVPGIHLQDQE